MCLQAGAGVHYHKTILHYHCHRSKWELAGYKKFLNGAKPATTHIGNRSKAFFCLWSITEETFSKEKWRLIRHASSPRTVCDWPSSARATVAPPHDQPMRLEIADQCRVPSVTDLLPEGVQWVDVLYASVSIYPIFELCVLLQVEHDSSVTWLWPISVQIWWDLCHSLATPFKVILLMTLSLNKIIRLDRHFKDDEGNEPCLLFETFTRVRSEAWLRTYKMAPSMPLFAK